MENYKDKDYYRNIDEWGVDFSKKIFEPLTKYEIKKIDHKLNELTLNYSIKKDDMIEIIDHFKIPGTIYNRILIRKLEDEWFLLLKTSTQHEWDFFIS